MRHRSAVSHRGGRINSSDMSTQYARDRVHWLGSVAVGALLGVLALLAAGPLARA